MQKRFYGCDSFVLSKKMATRTSLLQRKREYLRKFIAIVLLCLLTLPWGVVSLIGGGGNRNAHAAIHRRHSLLRLALFQTTTTHTRAITSARRPQLTQLFLSNKNNNNKEKKTTGPRIRFSTTLSDSRSVTTSNPIDPILQWIVSDIGSIVLGIAGLVVLVVGRLLLDSSSSSSSSSPVAIENETTAAQDLTVVTRSNLLAVFSAGAVLLNGLNKLDVESALAEQVVLVGSTLSEPVIVANDAEQDDNNNNNDNRTLRWVLESLVTATPAQSAVLLCHVPEKNVWKVQAAAGIVPTDFAITESSSSCSSSSILSLDESTTPILNRFLQSSKNNKSKDETYLPTLQALPGKTEFLPYLPVNTQAALLLPVLDDALGGAETTEMTTTTNKKVLVLGSNQARSFTPRDIAWCQTAVRRLAAEAAASS